MVSTVALFAAPAAMATGENSTTPSTSSSSTAAPKDDKGTPGKETSAAPTTSTTAKPDTKAPDAKAPVSKAAAGEAVVIPNPNKGDGPRVSVSGMPAKFVQGGDAGAFKASITNDKGRDLHFIPSIELENEAGSLRAEHLKVEYKHPVTGQWTSAWQQDIPAEDGFGPRVIAAFFPIDSDDETRPWELKDKATVTIDVRISFTAKAPLGQTAAAYVVLSGSKNPKEGGNDPEGGFVSISDGYLFDVVEAGKPAPKPDPNYKPKPPTKPVKPPVKKPGKELAATGSDDNNTPVLIGAAAGTALIAGAGFLVFSRRRKNGSAA
ncbi:LPXTG cell wall anchor domain-containing protein [Embleya sp. AB8]|uniref:LPXTG cell wall anchor domain-containing protein n=1 Tax=Embleya sp. AB8 TaxID=3156304 RepID=UPI003C7456B6